VSTDRQGRSGLGLEAQRAAVGRYLAGIGGILLAEHTEVETGRRNDRPELQKALAACRKHKARLVIAKLDRLSRNVAFDRRGSFHSSSSARRMCGFAVNICRHGTILGLLVECLVNARRGSAAFANDWQWLVGFPALAALLWFFRKYFSNDTEHLLSRSNCIQYVHSGANCIFSHLACLFHYPPIYRTFEIILPREGKS
jgi:hypothetical protein